MLIVQSFRADYGYLASVSIRILKAPSGKRRVLSALIMDCTSVLSLLLGSSNFSLIINVDLIKLS
jgi:hypothetical protein